MKKVSKKTKTFDGSITLVGLATKIDAVASSVEQLAIITKRGFDGVHSEINERFDGVDKRFDGVETRLGHVEVRLDQMDNRLSNIDSRLTGIDSDINALRGDVVYRREFEDALARIKYLEKKLSIESGVS